MIRKINRVGLNTLTVSLPRQWVKKYSVEKGDCILIKEKNQFLELSLKDQREEEAIINLDNLDRTTIIAALRAYYRKGVKTIILNFNQLETDYPRFNKKISVTGIVKEELTKLIGLEIIEQKVNQFVLKYMIKEEKNDFNFFLRKAFFLILDSFNELVYLSKNKSEIIIIKNNHDSLTRYVSFCIRLLNMFNKNNEIFSLRSILEQLELIVDILKSITVKLECLDIKFTSESIQWITNLRYYFADFIKAFYSKEINKIIELNKKRIFLEKQLITDSIQEDNRIILHELSTVLLIARSIIVFKLGMDKF